MVRLSIQACQPFEALCGTNRGSSIHQLSSIIRAGHQQTSFLLRIVDFYMGRSFITAYFRGKLTIVSLYYRRKSITVLRE